MAHEGLTPGEWALEPETVVGDPGLTRDPRCGVKNTGYNEEISKEGKGRNRLSS